MIRVRVLIADDSPVARGAIRRALESDPGIEVVAAARDGEDVIQKARQLRPDVITMDVNMPGMDGISALQIIVAERICPVIMLSSVTRKGALATFESLDLGAFDFVAKPDGSVPGGLEPIRDELCGKIRAAAAAGVLTRVLRSSGPPQIRAPRPEPTAARDREIRPAASPSTRFCAVAIGVSTGGPGTVSRILSEIPSGTGACFFLVQHMPPPFISTFVERLNRTGPMRVLEAQAGQVVQPNICYVAAGGRQMTLFPKSNGEIVVRTPSHPKTLFTPSVDVMMKSVLEVFGPRTVGVLLTGIGDDGADQMVAIRAAGGRTIAESAESAVVFGMPRAAIERGGAEIVAPSWEIAGKIQQLLQKENESEYSGIHRRAG